MCQIVTIEHAVGDGDFNFFVYVFPDFQYFFYEKIGENKQTSRKEKQTDKNYLGGRRSMKDISWS